MIIVNSKTKCYYSDICPYSSGCPGTNSKRDYSYTCDKVKFKDGHVCFTNEQLNTNEFCIPNTNKKILHG